MPENNQRSAILTTVMTPDMQNFSGNVHGGDILKLIDRAAYACAARYAKKNVVTLSVDQVIFKKPIHVGEIVTFYASVNFVGRTSMEIGIKITAENPLTGDIRHTNTCYLTWVAVDENGKPTALPPYTPETETEKRRHREAQLRQALQKEYQQRHMAIKSNK
ncbi:MAG: acyl-CoA thioesterase [Legionellaceae bacterium]|nr:acyl-CoA thioesterase [Legionellaceae bacterium]|tara:strand:- start:635 stop:1120 length:486 start_codon:yes stop_codon:yes gene_type:complete